MKTRTYSGCSGGGKTASRGRGPAPKGRRGANAVAGRHGQGHVPAGGDVPSAKLKPRRVGRTGQNQSLGREDRAHCHGADRADRAPRDAPASPSPGAWLAASPAAWRDARSWTALAAGPPSATPKGNRGVDAKGEAGAPVRTRGTAHDEPAPPRLANLPFVISSPSIRFPVPPP